MTRRSESIAIAAMLLLIVAAAALRLLPGLPGAVSAAAAGIAIVASVYSIVLWRREQSQDAATRALSARYLREATPALLAYVAGAGLSIVLLERVDAPALRALVALLPLPAIAIVLRATARYIRDLDELQRRIELEALALGSVAIAFAYLTAGLLHGAGVIKVSATSAMLWVLPSLSLAYAIAKRVVVRHYD